MSGCVHHGEWNLDGFLCEHCHRAERTAMRAAIAARDRELAEARGLLEEVVAWFVPDSFNRMTDEEKPVARRARALLAARPAPTCACLDGVITGMLEHAPTCPRADPRPAPRRYHPDCIHPESTDCYLCRADPRPAPACACLDGVITGMLEHAPTCPRADPRPAPRCICIGLDGKPAPEGHRCMQVTITTPRAEPPAPRCDCFDLADPATDRRRWKHLPDCPAAAKRGGGQ